MRGKKGTPHQNPADPPRRRANQKKGHGTMANDRPPIVATIGRTTGQVRLRVVETTDKETLQKHVHQFTSDNAFVYTDEWQGYNNINRIHATVCHGKKEWARDDDDDGINEVHNNTNEGLWTTVRNFLRPFRGVHKKYLAGYIAVCEFRINLKSITTDFISNLVLFP
jgi:transposase-like protein